MEFYENKIEQERAVLVSVDTGEFDVDSSLLELSELARTAGAEVICEMTQKRESPEAGTYLGRGKLEELAEYCENEKPDLVIVDGELTPAQQKNIETITDTRVIDRTTLILDIFAQRARTAEGRLQVELAQLKYRLPRLAGMGRVLSRQGGGIGSRGPGEAKLETDKRYIRGRIQKLEGQLKELTKRREYAHARRHKDGVITVAIVGYTNVGKSTLLNALTEAGVLAENMLFATLDPTSRALELPDGREVMLIDTVGLISRLPHNLVEAFKSTLEEAVNADLILNVCDISSNLVEEQIKITKDLIAELGGEAIPMITVGNKCDVLGEETVVMGEKSVFISAKTGYGFDKLLKMIAENLKPTIKRLNILVPYSDAGVLNMIRQKGKVFEELYEAEGIKADVLADITIIDKISEYIV